MNAPSPLAKLIRDSREQLEMTQDELARKVGLKAAVNVSKWEAGQPIPWHRLDAILKALPSMQADQYWSLVRKCQPEAIRKYNANRLKRDDAAAREAPASVLDFLSSRVRAKMESLHTSSSYVSLETMISVACEWYADLALAHGILSDLTPNIVIANQAATETLEPGGDALKKARPGHSSRKVAGQGG